MSTNYITGTSRSDSVYATELNDVIRLGGGGDVIYAYDGNQIGDTYFGESSSDHLSVGPTRGNSNYSGHDFFSGAGFSFDGGAGIDSVEIRQTSSGNLSLDLNPEYSFDLTIGNVQLTDIESLRISSVDTVMDVNLKLIPLDEGRGASRDFEFSSYNKGSEITVDFSDFDQSNSGSFGTTGGDGLPSGLHTINSSGLSIESGGTNSRNATTQSATVRAETVNVIGSQLPDRFTARFGDTLTIHGEGGADLFDIGTSERRGGDTFHGGDGNDIFQRMGDGINNLLQNKYFGEEGNDEFSANGRERALFDGGEGYDSVLFTREVKINLNKQSANRGEARKLELVDLEEFSLIGGSTFKGSSAAETVVVTAATRIGADTDVFGRNGDDTFMVFPTSRSGRLTTDNFFFSGGKGKDTFQIFNANQTFEPHVFDLMDRNNSTGFAKQITLRSVENITGSAINESIYGNNKRNVLSGQAGQDKLDGRRGKDTLDGGEGNDTLTGGAGRDTFVFARKYDIDAVTDFNVERDKIELDSRLLQGRDDPDRVVNRFAEVIGDRVEFDFGRGDILVLEGVSSLDGLADTLVLV